MRSNSVHGAGLEEVGQSREGSFDCHVRMTMTGESVHRPYPVHGARSSCTQDPI